MEKAKRFFKDNGLLLFAIIYLLLPADVIPDIIPFFGKIDDTSILVIDLIKRHLDSKASNEKN